MKKLIFLFCLWESGPVVLKFLGLMAPDVIPLNEDGSPYTAQDAGINAINGTKQPVYTKKKPEPIFAICGAFAIWLSWREAKF